MIDIIAASRKDTTQKQYKTYLKKWDKYCVGNNISQYSPSVADVLEYLTELFHSGLSYSSLNTARSALSAIINVQGKPVGEHPYVVRFLKGVFNLRPSMPKNTTTWDPEIVLKYLKTLPPVKKLDFKMLTLKCVTLLWLLSGQRGQSMRLIDFRNIKIDKDKVKISFGDVLKTTRPGYQQKEIIIKAFTPDRRICLVNTLKHYLSKRNELAKGIYTQLFISVTKPYEPVTTSTISRWVKQVMKNSGLDVGVFTPTASGQLALVRLGEQISL